MNPIDQILKEIEEWDKDGRFLAKLELKIKQILRDVYLRASDSLNDSYCIKFNLPNSEIMNLLDEVPQLNKTQLQYSMVKGWGQEIGVSRMREDYFYIVLIYIALYAMRRLKNKFKPHENPIAKNIQLLIMFRIWNGQLNKYIPICQPDVMKYVVAEKMNKNYLAHKFETPLQLLSKNYIDGKDEKSTIPKLYFPRMFEDSAKSIEMIDAPYKRIRQLFASTKAVNLVKDNATYKSGLAPLYHEATRNNERISTAKVSSDAETSDITQGFSSSSYDNLVENVVNYITMNSTPFYDKPFQDFLDKEIKKMKSETRMEILKSIHSVEYDDLLTDILENMLSRLSGTSKDEFCSPLFYVGVVKRKIVSSKHNPNVNKIKQKAIELLNDIFINKFKDNRFMSWSDTQKYSFINLVIYAIGYNLRRKICYEN